METFHKVLRFILLVISTWLFQLLFQICLQSSSYGPSPFQSMIIAIITVTMLWLFQKDHFTLSPFVIYRTFLWLTLAAISVWLLISLQQAYLRPTSLSQLSPTQPTVTPLIAPSFTPIPFERQITFQTDVLKGIIDKKGGNLVYLALLTYPTSFDETKPFTLLDHSVNRYSIAETDLLIENESVKNKKHHTYKSQQDHYTLSSQEETLCIHLERETKGVKIIKQFQFKKGQYEVDVDYQVYNNSQTACRVRPYAELTRSKAIPKTDTGGAISSDSKSYQKISLKRIDKQYLPQQTKHGWLSFVENYFVTAWISKLPTISYYSNHHNDLVTLGMIGPISEIVFNESIKAHLSLYAGPKSIKTLQKTAKHLERLVEYGIFSSIGKGMLWLLEQLYQWIGNWGWSIVVLALLLKVSFYPISAKLFHFDHAKRLIQPQVEILNHRYANDPFQLMQAKNALYRREGINSNMIMPLLGFLSHLPFFGLWGALPGNIILRHQHFTLWIQDLAAPDPYYILPILCGCTLLLDAFIDRKDNTGLLIMGGTFALLTFIIFTRLSSGLILYNIVQYLLSSLQKWWLLGRPLPDIFSLKR